MELDPSHKKVAKTPNGISAFQLFFIAKYEEKIFATPHNPWLLLYTNAPKDSPSLINRSILRCPHESGFKLRFLTISADEGEEASQKYNKLAHAQLLPADCMVRRKKIVSLIFPEFSMENKYYFRTPTINHRNFSSFVLIAPVASVSD